MSDVKSLKIYRLVSSGCYYVAGEIPTFHYRPPKLQCLAMTSRRSYDLKEKQRVHLFSLTSLLLIRCFHALGRSFVLESREDGTGLMTEAST